MDQQDNYLDYIPQKNTDLKWTYDEHEKVIIEIENKGFFHYIAQKLFHKPRITKVHLDTMGNFLWPLIDGVRTVYDLSGCVHEAFGDEAEPLYNRLVQYLKTLESYGFIQVSQIKQTNE